MFPADKIHLRTVQGCIIIHVATSHRDLRSPPGNMYEALNPPLKGYFSIRVNKQYRLVFR
ncbi:type II toxin-antitoxin system RelE/ParE family toxin [Enterobacter sichuanensis]|uniref:Type II toxin-antitoxin system RelE/ParE family toxin n=2 Tax=Enterobacter sichuanensis TaxID=2071710 RepID=A0AAE4DUR1_9ENTR|nr:type II toxin-antitoxin system RelE/ParE family toxin [Enterobacter sichuanensis]MDR0174120.1 type II toxin-antitoxin system RelE/ParE family toxin [Enterobacter sichuanensis]MDR9945500.1 type II toxin-antitoxin system RelE/ParE family toxin [Enterobacter sichuanensis]QFQ10412.1 hypothetical protein C1N69_17655 [Enterobacter sichuanensis]